MQLALYIFYVYSDWLDARVCVCVCFYEIAPSVTNVSTGSFSKVNISVYLVPF